MKSSSGQRLFAASSLLLSFSLLVSCPSSFAGDGLINKLVGVPFSIAGAALDTAGGVASAVAKTGDNVAGAVLNTAENAGTKSGSSAGAFSGKFNKLNMSNRFGKSAKLTSPEASDTDETANVPQEASRNHKSVGRDFPVLQGEVSTFQPHTAVSQSVNSLVDAALANDQRTPSLNKAVDHYGKLTSRIRASIGNGINFAVPNRGFNPSIEAGDVVTNENSRIKSLAAAELARQKHVDETHVKVVSTVMQIAMAMGMTDRIKGQQKLEAEYNSLRSLVGEEQASNTMSALIQWSSQAHVKAQEAAFNRDVWDIHEQREKKLTIMTTALNSDPVVSDVMRRLHKYNHRSKFARVSSRVVQTTLSTIALGPDFVGVGGKLALSAFVAATGGPEQDKIMKELYLGERLDSRTHVLNSEIQLAMENYQIGKLTRNAVLMAAAEAVIQQMAGPELLNEIFGRKTETSFNTLPSSQF